jgi:chemotaxis protein methyltransferase CheR
MSMTETDFDYVRTLVRERSAIVLEDNKLYLAEMRISQLAREEGFPSVEELIAKMRKNRLDALHTKVVEAMTTNETSFFRDLHPFEALKTAVIPEMMEKRALTRTLTIWSAACSTGQEAYTIAITIREHFPTLASWNVRILGTDLASDIVAKANQGRYGKIEINRGMPAPLLVKYFERDGLHWTVKEELRRMVEFRQMNLATPWSGVPAMDIVFLRNVLIYFSVETKKQILERVRQVLRTDGYLFLGGAETTLNVDERFQRVQHGKASCYRMG